MSASIYGTVVYHQPVSPGCSPSPLDEVSSVTGDISFTWERVHGRNAITSGKFNIFRAACPLRLRGYLFYPPVVISLGEQSNSDVSWTCDIPELVCMPGGTNPAVHTSGTVHASFSDPFSGFPFHYDFPRGDDGFPTSDKYKFSFGLGFGLFFCGGISVGSQVVFGSVPDLLTLSDILAGVSGHGVQEDVHDPNRSGDIEADFTIEFV